MSFPVTENIAKSQRHISFYLACGMPESPRQSYFSYGDTLPLSVLSGALKSADKVAVAVEAAAAKFARILKAVRTRGRLPSARCSWSWRGYMRCLSAGRRVERIDHDGLHEAGYGPDDFE